MRACGNIGVANEKSVPRRVSAQENRYSVSKTDGSCMPAQTHGVGVVWEGGWAMCGRERWRVWEVRWLRITKGMCVGARKDYLRRAGCEFYECAVGSLVGMALGV